MTNDRKIGRFRLNLVYSEKLSNEANILGSRRNKAVTSTSSLKFPPSRLEFCIHIIEVLYGDLPLGLQAAFECFKVGIEQRTIKSSYQLIMEGVRGTTKTRTSPTKEAIATLQSRSPLFTMRLKLEQQLKSYKLLTLRYRDQNKQQTIRTLGSQCTRNPVPKNRVSNFKNT